MEKNKKKEYKVVETYAGDMAEVIENDKEGLVKKIIHDEEEHEIQKRDLSPESKKNKFFMFSSFLLITLTLIILSFFIFKKEKNIVPVEKQFTPIIFNDKSIFLEVAGLKRGEIAQVVLNEVNTTKVKAGGVEGIYLTENKQILGLRRFISLIESNFIPSDNILFVNDNFLIGVVNSAIDEPVSGSVLVGKSAHPSGAGGDLFILLKVRSATDIFDALRAWEGKIFSELHTFFGVNISADTGYLLTKDFEDGIVENKNARILYSKDNQIVLMYVFADNNSIIITNSQKAIHEIMLRLSSGQKKQ